MDFGLNPFLLPLPDACTASLLNVACASLMSDLCAVSNQDGLSLLLDGNSNCATWKAFIEEVHDIDPSKAANLTKFLDSAVEKYCSGAFGGNGYNSNECQCLNMPIFAAATCAEQDCTNENPDDCNGQHFMRSNQGFTRNGQTYSGNFIDVSFPECIPQICWNQQCWNPNTLLKTAQRDKQKNCVTGVCMSIIGTDTITSEVAPASAFVPSSFIQNCGDGPVDPYPIYIPTSFKTAVDNVFSLPVSIANGGNLGGLTLYFQKTKFYDNDIGVTVPDQIFVASNGRTVFQIKFDYTILYAAWQKATDAFQTEDVTIIDLPQCLKPCSVPSYTIVSPIFYYAYYNRGVKQIFTFTLNLVLTPPIGTQQRQPENPIVMNKEIPLFLYIPVAISAFFVLLTWIFYVTATRRASIALEGLKQLVQTQ